MCFWPHLHTHRGYDQADYKAGQRHRYFTVIILQPSRMSMDTLGSECKLSPGYTLSPAVALYQGSLFGGENKHGPGLSKRWATIFWKSLWQAAYRFNWKFHRDIILFWADLLRKLCTPNFGKYLHLKSNTLLNWSSYTYILWPAWY